MTIRSIVNDSETTLASNATWPSLIEDAWERGDGRAESSGKVRRVESVEPPRGAGVRPNVLRNVAGPGLGARSNDAGGGCIRDRLGGGRAFGPGSRRQVFSSDLFEGGDRGVEGSFGIASVEDHL